jgi:hypothetical protein
MPAKWDVTIMQGESFLLRFKYYDDTGALVDLTGDIIRMSIRKTKEDSTVIASTEGVSPTLTATHNGTGGTITVVMDEDNTALLDFIRAVYDLEVDDGTDVYRVLEGEVTLNKEVTR